MQNDDDNENPRMHLFENSHEKESGPEDKQSLDLQIDEVTRTNATFDGEDDNYIPFAIAFAMKTVQFLD